VCVCQRDAGLQFWVSPISTTLEQLRSLKKNDKDERERMKKRERWLLKLKY